MPNDESQSLVLPDAEAVLRQRQLADVQIELHSRGVKAVQARHHRLALSGRAISYGPSGQTDPVLHVFGPSGARKVTTDGESFWLDGSESFPIDDVAELAAVIAAEGRVARA